MKHSEFWETCTTYNDCEECPLGYPCTVDVRQLERDEYRRGFE